jgi:outer membrane biosynthesis protein TonB
MKISGSLSHEDLQAWTLSLLAHGVIAVLLLLWKLDLPVPQPEFLELSLGIVTTLRPTPVAAKASKTGSPEIPAKREQRPSAAPALPERALNTGDDVLHVPAAKKLDVDERPRPGVVSNLTPARREKEAGIAAGVQNRENAREPGQGTGLAAVTEPGTLETMGQGSGTAVSYYMQWSDGGTRRKISGALPEYPRGANVEAQIKLGAVVLPDGTIKSLKPLQKGNTRLEEAAMKEVRLWRFEPLKSSVPQREQACSIAFNFRLR